MKDQSGNLMLAHDGTELEAGQVWLSRDGEFESLLIGVGSQGFPVFEKLDGWSCQGGYFDIEKYWKSLFVHQLKPNRKDDGSNESETM